MRVISEADTGQEYCITLVTTLFHSKTVILRTANLNADGRKTSGFCKIHCPGEMSAYVVTADAGLDEDDDGFTGRRTEVLFTHRRNLTDASLHTKALMSMSVYIVLYCIVPLMRSTHQILLKQMRLK